jgi:polysaccharide biosynthesis/export protein
LKLARTIGRELAAFLVLTLTACGPQAVTTTTSSHPPTDPGPYTIGINDVLDIIVWRQTQLSGKIPVEDDGSIAVPLAGRVPAAGLTCQTLEKNLYEKLAPFIHDPRVTVRVADPRSKVFYVIGEVKKPGVMRLASGEVLSQGLAEAGGFTDFANLRDIRIVRRESTENVKITVNYNKVDQGDLTADIPLEPGDTITVP